MIGLLGAMKIEVEALCGSMEQTERRRISGVEFIQGTLRGVPCVVAECGVGKVNAAVCTQIMIFAYGCEAVINTGVAGGIGTDVRIGDVVIARDVVQHDMDTTALGDQKGLLPGINLVHIPCAEEWVLRLRKAAEGLGGTCHVGTVVTGDQFIGAKETLHALQREFGGIACEMEGGAVGQVCRMNGVPFAVVRAISDNADGDAHMDYAQFLPLAAERSAALLFRTLEGLREE